MKVSRENKLWLTFLNLPLKGNTDNEIYGSAQCHVVQRKENFGKQDGKHFTRKVEGPSVNCKMEMLDAKEEKLSSSASFLKDKRSFSFEWFRKIHKP